MRLAARIENQRGAIPVFVLAGDSGRFSPGGA